MNLKVTVTAGYRQRHSLFMGADNFYCSPRLFTIPTMTAAARAGGSLCREENVMLARQPLRRINRTFSNPITGVYAKDGETVFFRTYKDPLEALPMSPGPVAVLFRSLLNLSSTSAAFSHVLLTFLCLCHPSLPHRSHPAGPAPRLAWYRNSHRQARRPFVR